MLFINSQVPFQKCSLGPLQSWEPRVRARNGLGNLLDGFNHVAIQPPAPEEPREDWEPPEEPAEDELDIEEGSARQVWEKLTQSDSKMGITARLMQTIKTVRADPDQD
eukprot:3936868-Rhodomonas_salina.1